MYQRAPYIPKAEQAEEKEPADALPFHPDDLEIGPLIQHADRRPPPQENSLMYGAPPSKSWNGTPGTFNERPGRFHMSAAEAEIARLCSLEPQEYVKQRLRLEREKKLGMRQNG
jgi:hypothetical protein